MKTVPLKKTIEVNISDAILSFATCHCSKEQLDPLTRTLETIQKCRKDMEEALNNSLIAPDQLLLSLRHWLSYIVILENRLPFGSPDGVDVQFTWTCSFFPKVSTSFSSIFLEKLCVIFNIGAVYSSLAYGCDRTTTDGVKEAVNRLQTAAAIFSIVRSQVSAAVVAKSELDLCEPTLSLYIALMSAQAQTCIYEKAVKVQLNRSLLSKLATQTAQFYDSARSFACSIIELPCSLKSWLEVQRLAFLSAGHYQRGLFDLIEVERRSDGYGNIVARLRCAVNNCCQAIELAKTAGLTADLSVLREAAEKKLEALEKDNKTVYLEVVPPEASLPSLEAICGVSFRNFVSMNDLCLPLQGDVEVFDCVIPIGARQVVEEFNYKVSELINPITETTASLSQEIDTFCAERGLPFLLLEKPQVSSYDSLWKRIEEARSLGGVEAAEDLLLVVESGAKTCSNSLESLEQRLLQEEKINEQYILSYGPSWNRPSSKQLTEVYWQSIRKYKDKLKIAIHANQIVKDSLTPALSWRDVLSQSQGSTEVALPADCDAQREQETEQCRVGKKEVQLALDSLTSCMSSVEIEVNEMKSFPKDVGLDLKGSIIKTLNSVASSVPTLINHEIDVVKGRLHSVSLKLDGCKELFEDLVTVWENQKVHIETLHNKERVKTLKSLNDAATAISRVQHDAKDGLTFFDTLSNCIRSLSLQIDTYLAARREEAFEVLKTLTRRSYSNLLTPSVSTSYVAPYSTLGYTPSPPVRSLSYYPPPPVASFPSALAHNESDIRFPSQNTIQWPHYPQQIVSQSTTDTSCNIQPHTLRHQQSSTSSTSCTLSTANACNYRSGSTFVRPSGPNQHAYSYAHCGDLF